MTQSEFRNIKPMHLFSIAFYFTKLYGSQWEFHVLFYYSATKRLSPTIFCMCPQSEPIHMCVNFGEDISIRFGVIDIYMKKHVKND